MEMGGQCHGTASTSPVNNLNTHFKGGWLGPRFSLDGYGEEKSFAPARVQVQHIACHYTNYAILALEKLANKKPCV